MLLYVVSLLSDIRRQKTGEDENQPRDWTIDDVVTVAGECGLEVRSPGGSHYTISHPEVDFHLTIPAKRPIKPVYIRDLVKFIDAIREKQNETS